MPTHPPRCHPLGQVDGDRARAAADVEQVDARPQVGEQVRGRVLHRPPAVRAQHALGVPVRVGLGSLAHGRTVPAMIRRTRSTSRGSHGRAQGGHRPRRRGKAVFVSDGPVAPDHTALLPGSEFHQLWGGDEAPHFPDDGVAPDAPTLLPARRRVPLRPLHAPARRRAPELPRRPRHRGGPGRVRGEAPRAGRPHGARRAGHAHHRHDRLRGRAVRAGHPRARRRRHGHARPRRHRRAERHPPPLEQPRRRARRDRRVPRAAPTTTGSVDAGSAT